MVVSVDGWRRSEGSLLLADTPPPSTPGQQISPPHVCLSLSTSGDPCASDWINIEACWLHRGHVQRWLPGEWREPLFSQRTAPSCTRRRRVGTRSSCIPNGPRWLRNSWRGRTRKIWSGTRRRDSTLSLYTPKQTPPTGRMNCRECFPTLGGPIPPCTPTDRGPSGSTLASALWRRATSSIKITSKVDLVVGYICSWNNLILQELHWIIIIHIIILYGWWCMRSFYLLQTLSKACKAKHKYLLFRYTVNLNNNIKYCYG